ncbi:PaaI family thioesterase [Aurantivibrio plasticivorans]
MTAPAKGFEPLFRTSPYLDLIGPIFCRKNASKDTGPLTIGFTAQEKHCNANGSVHGGIIGGIADITLGYNSSLSVSPPINMVTTNLTIDYAGSIRCGDWVEVDADVQKVGGRVAFANCYFMVEQQRIIRASGVFTVLR